MSHGNSGGYSDVTPSTIPSDGHGVTMYLVTEADIRPWSPPRPPNPNGVPLSATCRAIASHAANSPAAKATTLSPALRHQASSRVNVSTAPPAASGTNAPRMVNGLKAVVRGTSTANGVTTSHVST